MAKIVKKEIHMTYRIFKFNANTRTFTRRHSQADDITVKGSFDEAAIEWATTMYGGTGIELVLLVARFGSSAIDEIRYVRLVRNTPPWSVASMSVTDLANLYDDEDENCF